MEPQTTADYDRRVVAPIWWTAVVVLAGPGVIVAFIELPFALLTVIAVCATATTISVWVANEGDSRRDRPSQTWSHRFKTDARTIAVTIGALGMIWAAEGSAVIALIALGATSPSALRCLRERLWRTTALNRTTLGADDHHQR